MSDHGTVQSILRHDAAPSPGLLGLPPLGATILEPHLVIENKYTFNTFLYKLSENGTKAFFDWKSVLAIKITYFINLFIYLFIYNMAF